MQSYLEFDAYSPPMRCLVTLLSLARSTEALALKLLRSDQTPVLAWEDFLRRAKLAPGYESQNETRQLDEFFRHPPRPLTGRNIKAVGRGEKDTLLRVCDFVSGVLSSTYFAEGAILQKCQDDAWVASLDLPKEHYTQTNSLASLVAQIARYKDAKELYSFIHPLIQERSKPDQPAERFLDSLRDGEPKLRHPSYRSLDLKDLRAAKTEYHSIDEASSGEANWGLFLVVRESKGLVADRQEVNQIVRDVLFILPADRRKEEFVGFYVDASENEVHILQDIIHRDPTITVRGRPPGRKNAPTHWIELSFGTFEDRGALQFRQGIETGTLHEPRTPYYAAWKALVVRPSKNYLRLEGMLLQFGADDGKAVKDVVNDVLAASPIYSPTMANETSHRREAFRALVSTDSGRNPEYFAALQENVSAEVAQALFEQLRRDSEDTGRSKSSHDAEVELLQTIRMQLAKVMHLIEPAQIVTLRSSDGRTSDETIKHLQYLLEVDNLPEDRIPPSW